MPEEEQVVVALHVGERRPHVRANPALRVFLGECPELAGDEHPVAGVDVLVDVVLQLHPERVVDRVPRDVVRVPEVVHVEFPMNLLDAGHAFSLRVWISSMYWSAVLQLQIRRRFASSTMSCLSWLTSSGCAVRRFHADAHDRHGRLPRCAHGCPSALSSVRSAKRSPA